MARGADQGPLGARDHAIEMVPIAALFPPVTGTGRGFVVQSTTLEAFVAPIMNMT